MRFVIRFLACVLFAGSLSPLAAQDYRLKTQIQIGGDGAWDFIELDSDGRRFYLPHGNTVSIIDTDKNTVVGEIEDTVALSGIAVAHELGKAFTRHGGRDPGIGIVDLKTGHTSSRIGTPAPDYSMYEPGQKEVWVFNVRDAQSASVIDAVSAKVIATISLGGTPELAAADPKAHRLYLNLIDRNAVVAIDTQAHKILATWPLAPCETPTGMVIDVEHHRLFSSCRGKKPVAVMMDNTNGKVLASVPIGQGADEIAYDPATRLIFVASGGSFQNPVESGSLTIIKEETPDKLVVVQTLKTADGVKAVVLDTKTHNIYLPVTKFEPLKEGEVRPKRIPGSLAVLVYGPK